MIEFNTTNNSRRNYYTNSYYYIGVSPVTVRPNVPNGFTGGANSQTSTNAGGTNSQTTGANGSGANSQTTGANGPGTNSQTTGVGGSGANSQTTGTNGSGVNSQTTGTNGSGTNSQTAPSTNRPVVPVTSSPLTIGIDEVTPAGIAPVSETAVSFIEAGGTDDAEKSDVLYEETAAKNPADAMELIPESESMLPDSYVRMYNFIPGGQEVDVYINGYLAKENMAPGTGTRYIKLPPDMYEIEFRASEDNRLLNNYKLKALSDKNSTLALSGSGNIYSALDISGSAPKCFFNTAYMRFAQLAMNAPAMDIYVDGVSVIVGLRFGEVSAFIGVPEGTHRIKATATGTGIIYIDETHNFPAGSVNEMLISSKDADNYILNIITDENGCA